MLRLVSQFDNEKARVSVATPTCCCSCIITALSSSIFTARSLGKLVEEQQQSSEHIEHIPFKMSRITPLEIAHLIGFLLLPIALGVPFLVSAAIYNFWGNSDYSIQIVFLGPILIFGGGLYLFHRNYGLSWTKVSGIFFLTPIGLFIVEPYAWMILASLFPFLSFLLD